MQKTLENRAQRKNIGTNYFHVEDYIFTKSRNGNNMAKVRLKVQGCCIVMDYLPFLKRMKWKHEDFFRSVGLLRPDEKIKGAKKMYQRSVGRFGKASFYVEIKEGERSHPRIDCYLLPDEEIATVYERPNSIMNDKGEYIIPDVIEMKDLLNAVYDYEPNNNETDQESK